MQQSKVINCAVKCNETMNIQTFLNQVINLTVDTTKSFDYCLGHLEAKSSLLNMINIDLFRNRVTKQKILDCIKHKKEFISDLNVSNSDYFKGQLACLDYIENSLVIKLIEEENLVRR
jgi:hypothetical protein